VASIKKIRLFSLFQKIDKQIIYIKYISLSKSIMDQLFNDYNFDIHIRVQVRNGKKSWTFIENLDKVEQTTDKKEQFMENEAKALKSLLHCSATIKKPENTIQLQGDHRDKIKKYLLDKKYVRDAQIKMHGF
jgi:translation initiation factor SUI1